MMLGDEGIDRRAHRLRHRHHVDEIAARFGPGFALGGIGGHRENLVWRLDASRAQRNPEHGRARAKVVPSPSCDSVVQGEASGSPTSAVTGFQMKSIQGLCALRRSTTTPTAILTCGAMLTTPPRDGRSEGRSRDFAASYAASGRASSPIADRWARLSPCPG